MRSVIFCPLFSSSLHLTVLTIRLFLFFMMINKRQLGVGPDETDEVGERNARGTRRRGGQRVRVTLFFVLPLPT